MKSLRWYIIILTCLITIYLAAQYNRPKPIDWTETYSSADKIPFGTYILFNRLNDIFPNAKVQQFREPLYNVIHDHGISNASYLIVCNSVGLNEYDYKKLIQFIKNGNDVFISATYFGDELGKQLKIGTASELNIQGGIKFLNPKLDTSKTYMTDGKIGDVYFNQLDTTKLVALGTNIFHHANFLKYSVGKGNLFLHANPRLFTNYSLVNKEGVDYAAKALSFIKNNKTLVWDQYYALGREGEDSSMRVFLQHDALRWAFYIAFFSLLAFVVYEMKRRQRIIPIIEPLENTTLAFVNVVGQVYYEQHDNRNISHKKILYFLEYIRATYYLKTNALDEEFIDALSQKTAIEHDFATELVNCINYMNAVQQVNNGDLLKLNQLIEQFYKQSK